MLKKSVVVFLKKSEVWNAWSLIAPLMEWIWYLLGDTRVNEIVCNVRIVFYVCMFIWFKEVRNGYCSLHHFDITETLKGVMYCTIFSVVIRPCRDTRRPISMIRPTTLYGGIISHGAPIRVFGYLPITHAETNANGMHPWFSWTKPSCFSSVYLHAQTAVCRWHMHLTNQGNFNYGKKHEYPQLESHVQSWMAPTSWISGLYLLWHQGIKMKWYAMLGLYFMLVYLIQGS